jgi:hypothetical protein
MTTATKRQAKALRNMRDRTPRKTGASYKQRSRNTGRTILAIAFLFTIGTIFASYSFVRDFQYWMSTQESLPTKATIRSIKAGSIGSGRGGKSFSFDIEYQYILDGTSYVSSHYGFNQKSRAEYDELRKHYLDGQPITCYVAKDDHTRATIDLSLSPLTKATMIVLPCALMVCSGMLWFGTYRSWQ